MKRQTQPNFKPPKEFVSLHSHSGFSTFDGMDYPQEHIDFVIENGGKAWALTDHGQMNGFAHAYLHAHKKDGFKFIPGCEMYVHPDLELWNLQNEYAKAQQKQDSYLMQKLEIQADRLGYPPLGQGLDDNEEVDTGAEDAGLTVENEEASKRSKYYDPRKRRHHLVVLPKSSLGLERLFGLVSKGYIEGYYRFPRVDYKMLKEAAFDEQGESHLIVSSACLTGEVSLVTDYGVQTLLDVVTRYKNGEKVQVLSYNENTKKQEFKTVLWGDMTRKNAKLLKITTEDGKSITCTPDHKVYTNEGWVEAQELLEKKYLKLLSI